MRAESDCILGKCQLYVWWLMLFLAAWANVTKVHKCKIYFQGQWSWLTVRHNFASVQTSLPLHFSAERWSVSVALLDISQICKRSALPSTTPNAFIRLQLECCRSQLTQSFKVTSWRWPHVSVRFQTCYIHSSNWPSICSPSVYQSPSERD